ncbi:conserved membrane hypothetical protein [Hyella patelloides LEGE 07179]|uniref:Glycerophosphoryl diester phosphodiesterase membrane domain-containing protein n=1 Tax=Hyella patelloides LEGE 07179 TaxID=945734 RepID=A0A563W0K6_9CYAN|nr:DUF975 domain-containing protein [Hyella patelloides]VEP17175.1 conserved membrane hypothetical protein [Hyella patelloides LEGE 07179]
MKPLSVGNVVTAGLRIYRDHFKEYFGLAFIAYLWVFIPIYGWAKFSAINSLISRLAYGEATNKPELIKDARRHIKSRMWGFLIAGILVGLASLMGFIFLLLIFGAISILTAFIGGEDMIVGIIIGIVSTLTGLFILFFGTTWLISRFLIFDLPLAIEENMTPLKSIKRGWMLTKGSVLRLQLIIFVSFLISLPISIFTNIFTNILSFILTQIAFSDTVSLNSNLSILFVLAQILIILSSAALVVPFWQSIKAVIYYDLLVRKEGLGLDLEDNSNFS